MSFFGGSNNKPATGLFGSQSAGNLFGTTNTNTTNTNPTPTGGFGSLVPQQQQPQGSGGGLFGSNQPQPTQGGLFGGTGGGFGSSTSTTGTGSNPFGSTSANPAGNTGGTAGGFFGTKNVGTGAPTGGLFANTSNTGTSTSGIFGQPSGNTNPSPFGNTNMNINTNTGTGTGAPSGGLFGGTTNTGAGASGIFGQPSVNTNPSPFGNTNTNTNTGTGPSTGGLFGNTGNTGAGTSSIFGQPSVNTNPSPFGQQPPQQQQQQQPATAAPLFSSFGQTQNQNQPQAQTGFGTLNSNPGQPQSLSNTNPGSGFFSAPPASNPFASSLATLSQPATTNSIFGPKPPSSTSSSFFPGSQSYQSSDNSAQAQAAALQQRLEAIVAAWNPQSPQCRFQHYFYNLVDPRQVAMYGRPANATNDALWQQAVRENPDPSSMVPALAIGFDDLQKRVEAQSKQAALQQEKLKELQTRLSTLSQTHLLSNTLRTTRALQTHTLITHRLLRLIEHIHLLIPSLRSAAINPEEEALRAKLERLKDEVQRSLGGGGGRGRVNELWALLGAVKAAKERDAGVGRDAVEWKVVDQDGLERLTMILAEQQQGLAHLTSIINNDMKDLQIMEGGGEASVEVDSPQRAGGSSTSLGLTKSSTGMLSGR